MYMLCYSACEYSAALWAEPAAAVTIKVRIVKSSDNQGHIEILLIFSLYSIYSHNSY